MAENKTEGGNTQKDKARKKWTPAEHAVRFNSGAAYAVATGDLMGGMGLVFGRSRDLSSEPIIQKIMVSAQLYLASQGDYSAKMQKWEKADKKTRGDAPKQEQTTELAYAQKDYLNLIESSEIRSNMFTNNYNELTINQAKDVTLYGKMPRNAPESVIKLINDNKGIKVKDIQDEKLKTAVEAFGRYHVLGNTARDVQGIHLSKTLEGLATEQENTI